MTGNGCVGGVRRHDRNRAVAEREIASVLRRWRSGGLFLAVGLDRPGFPLAVVGEELWRVVGHGRVVVSGRVDGVRLWRLAWCCRDIRAVSGRDTSRNHSG